ncbi:hypothetical protein LTT02_20855 [Mycolicibacterium smegmatis]|uniref:hypothetical protein n=1 Tax=Mycolicibacterium smegmatis TaxID=1772 RepID=UPI001CBAA2D5|nr:hypothetical protein [Mycolicibacterium smegmatis]UAK57899.1 hypothetical protein K8P01_14930 [Mycolicibacterium smegmatis]UGT73243.1 hypothetical protein LTT02_20855 [Mycolicibacterium smegmatis]
MSDDLPTADKLGLPQQSLLTEPMRRQPVPGWTVEAADLGLQTKDRIRFSPIGNDGDRALFLAMTVQEAWVIGIDVGSGHKLFEPVWLGNHGSAEALLATVCHLNGASMVLCLREDPLAKPPARAWVIDTATGELIYDGPTELRQSQTDGHPILQRLGDHLVALVDGQGVHGIGERAELTWHVIGTGSLTYPDDDSDVAPPDLAVQSRLREPDVVFSVADGTVLTPAIPAGEQVRRAAVYPGGFAYELARDHSTGAGIAFFDDKGRQTGRLDGEAKLLTGSEALPMAQLANQDQILSVTGTPLLSLPKSTLLPYTRLAGTTLLVSTDEEHSAWQQFDLRSGDSGVTCNNEALWYSYIGSSGDIVLTGGGRTPVLAQAIDLTTCETLWTLPGSTESEAKDLWRVNETLILRVNNQLSSLVSPD